MPRFKDFKKRTDKKIDRLKVEEKRLAKEAIREKDLLRPKRRKRYKRYKGKNNDFNKDMSDYHHTRSGDLLNDLDLMTLAKRFPGTFDAPYVAGMNTTPLATIQASTGFTLTEASVGGGARASLGTNSYTLLMYAPSIASLDHPTHAAFLPRETRISGLSVSQHNDTTGVISAKYFWHTNTATPLETISGSNMDVFAEKGFPWASKITLEVVAPNATIAGRMWKGRIMYGQLFDQSIPNNAQTTWADGGGKSISIEKLINLSQEIELGEDNKFSLQSAVVNNNLAYNQIVSYPHANTPNEASLARYLDVPGAGAEIIEYCIIVNAAMSLTDSSLIPFRFASEVNSNYVFWPEIDDAIINNLFRTQQLSNSATHMSATATLDDIESNIGTTQIIQQNPRLESSFKQTASGSKGGGWLSRVSSWAKRNKGLLRKGINAVSDYIPGGTFIKAASDYMLSIKAETPIYIGTTKLRIKRMHDIPLTGDHALDSVISDFNNQIEEIRTLLLSKPDYYLPVELDTIHTSNDHEADDKVISLSKALDCVKNGEQDEALLKCALKAIVKPDPDTNPIQDNPDDSKFYSLAKEIIDSYGK